MMFHLHVIRFMQYIIIQNGVLSITARGMDVAFGNIMMDKKEDMRKIIQGCDEVFTGATGKGFQYRDDE